MNFFSIEDWVSGYIDFESKYYRLLSYLKSAIDKYDDSRQLVLKDLENKIVELHCVQLDYSVDEDKIALIDIGRFSIIKVYNSLLHDVNVFDDLKSKKFW
jgi:hypothetical protein